ncbi:MAG: hypothetical protein ACQERO_11080 [Bacteroidota bacterium]
MSSSKVLCTTPSNVCGDFIYFLEKNSERFLHMPLEEFELSPDRMAEKMLAENVDNFTFVVYGNLRNATYFYNWIDQQNLVDEFRNLVHLTLDEPASDFLEDRGIPAIQPRKNARPIDLLEFMLRISKEGKTLYPACSNRAEEMPGLLQELEMDVAEFTICREKGLSTDRVEELQIDCYRNPPEAVLFHNRSSVNRALAAFPDLNFKQMTIFSGSAGVTKHLIDKGYEPHHEADGTWSSIEQLLKDKIFNE